MTRIHDADGAATGGENGSEIEVSFCIVNTEQRELLIRGLDAIAREVATLPFATEVLVLDNASLDGSAQAARSPPIVDGVVELDQRTAKSENDTTLLQRARGRFCLLLNEDSELLAKATLTLHREINRRPRAGAVGAALFRPAGQQQASAWRFPTPYSALMGAAFLHKLFVVQSRGQRTREVDWAQSAALMVRREAAEAIGFFDPNFFVYSDEVDFCKRLRDAGWTVHYAPHARVIHHEQLSTGSVPNRRIVELSRNRDLYMRKHHSPAAARAVRWFTAWTYGLRALAALFMPNHKPQRYLAHVKATLYPYRGVGLREGAEDFNRDQARESLRV